MAVPINQNTVIAGKTSGIKVLCSPKALDVYNSLVKLGQRGNHWARLIVNGIAGLSSSRLGMDNVFTKKGAGIAYGRGAFYVALPGVMATFEALDDSSFVLLHLNIDKNNSDYFGGQKEAKNPGLWRVRLLDDKWKPKFVSDGRLLLKHKNRYVAVSDTKFSSIQDATNHVSASLQGVNDTVKNIIEGPEGFDMHFTPGHDRDDGLVSSKQTINNTGSSVMIRDSSQLLANTMHQSRDNKNIQWFSDWGGSAVLTNAMQILSDQQVTLPKHTILLNRPTSRPGKALELGRSLGLTPFDGGQIRGITPKELIGRLGLLDTPISSVQRLLNDDSYTAKDMALGAAGSSYKIAGLGVGGLGVLGSVGLVSAGIASAPAVGVVGSALFVTGLIIKSYKNRRKHN